MSQAEELLSTMAESGAAHSHVMTDSDPYFVIDPNTRIMSNGSSEPVVIMQYDHNSVVLTFELPRFVEGHDMMLCNSVLVHWNNVSEFTIDERAESTDIYDLRVNPKDSSTVICSWTVSRNSTQHAGNLSFLVQYKCVENDAVTYEWHTDIYTNVEIRSGRNNGEQSVIDYTDVIEQWRTKLFGASDVIVGDIAIAAETQKASIATKGEKVLATIPDDYTTTYNMARSATRTRANAIVITAEGDSIVVDDCSNDYLRGLRVYGKTTQVNTTGAQLFNGARIINITGQGITMENDGLGRISLYGTATSSFSSVNIAIDNLAPGTYSVSGEITGKAYFYVRVTLADGTLKYYKAPNVFTLDGTETEILGYIYGPQGGVSFNGEVICPMLNSGDIDLPWEPYSGGVASPSLERPQDIVSVMKPVVSIYGKNLFNVAAIGSHSALTNNGDGTITAKVNTAQTVQTLAYLCPALKVGDIATFSLKTPAVDASNGKPRDYIYLVQAKTVWNNRTSKIVTQTMLNSQIYFYASTDDNGDGIDTVVSEVQIELGERATGYEPYIEPQSITLPYTLRAMPVESGGNYIDSDGRQWIGDEIDFERGMYVQRVYAETATTNTITSVDNSYVSTSGSVIYLSLTHKHYADDTQCLVLSDKLLGVACNKRGFDNDIYRCYAPEINLNVVCLRPPVEEGEMTLEAAKTKFAGVKVAYVLADPIETTLTDEELFAFSKLHSNYLVTTARNSGNAYMGMTYNADTQKYFTNTRASDEQVQAAVDTWLSKYFSDAEGVSF